MVHGKIQAFINKAKTYAKGGGTTPHELQTLHTEAVSLSKQISLGAIREDDKIIEKLQQLVQTRNHALQSFDSLATEYYSLLETLLKYGTGYRTKMVKELSETMQGCYLKYDEYLEICKRGLTRPLIAYKKTYEKSFGICGWIRTLKQSSVHFSRYGTPIIGRNRPNCRKLV